MKLVALRALLVPGIALYSCAACAEQEIQPGRSVTSPDGRFTAELTNDTEGNLHIKSNMIGKLYKVSVFRPLYSLKWTGDSQTVVTIEHLAGGSQAVLIRFDGDKWSRSEVDPTKAPPPYHHYAVVQQGIGWDTVKLTYKVTDEKGNGTVTNFYLCSFDVDARTKSMTNLHKEKISGQAYRALGYQSADKK